LPVVVQVVGGGQVPQTPPQPSSPHWRPAQLGLQLVGMQLPLSVSQVELAEQMPHEPPQLSGPHGRP
jgi:hypothetical protein